MQPDTTANPELEKIDIELARLDQEAEVKLVQRPYLKYRDTVNPSQLPVHKSTAFERWVFAGNGMGKDALMVNEFGWHCLGDYPDWFPEEGKVNPTKTAIRARYCCTTFNDGIKQIVIPEFKKWFPGLFRHREKDNVLYWPTTGSEIYLKTYDQDTDSYAGANLHLIGQSEHCPKDKYEENLTRLRGLGVRRFIGEMTPTEGMSWEYDEIYEKWERRQRTPPDLEVFRGKTADNVVNLSEAYLKRLENLDPQQRQIRLYGDFIQLSGLVYKNYRDWLISDIRPGDNHGGHLVAPFDIPLSWPRAMCIDPHNRKPFALLWRAISPDGTCYYYDEFKPEQGGLLIKDYADTIRQKEGPLFSRMAYRLIDTSARVEDPITGLDFQQEFARYGVVTRVVRKAEKAVDPGIQKVSEGFVFTEHPYKPGQFFPRILIFNDLYNLRYELKHYVWDEYAREREKHDIKDKPRKKDDDLLDDMKYLEMSGNRYEPVTLIQPRWSTGAYGTGRG